MFTYTYIYKYTVIFFYVHWGGGSCLFYADAVPNLLRQKREIERTGLQTLDPKPTPCASSQFKNNYFAEILRARPVYHSTLSLRVTQKKNNPQ